MTFWGVEVKPGKPFTLKNEDLGGKLVLTQATLGAGTSTKKSTLQCNVGDKSPVYLCTLLPDKLECCSLTLEFEEDDDVKFSVIGPTSIHLSGFVQADPRDSEDGDGYGFDSYGEDITETESNESDDDSEEDSEDDFIDDDEMDMYPASHAPKSGVVIEEIEDDDKSLSENGKTKQTKKKTHSTDSADEQKTLVIMENNGASVLESEDEDGFPVSVSRKSEHSSKKHGAKTEGEQGGENKKKNDGKGDDEGAKSLKRKIDTMDHDEEPKRTAEQTKDTVGAAGFPDENVNKKKKKKGKSQDVSIIQDKAAPKDSHSAGSCITEDIQNQSGASDSAGVATGDAGEGKKKKKKKKKAKIDNGDEDLNPEQDAGTEAKKTPKTEEKANQFKAKPAKARTFSNGLVVEELQMGKPNGKRASKGSKVKVHYIGKLQKNGKIFDSNIGRAPFQFRLGIGQVIKGWDVGVEGMRIGDKRRLLIPPSMGYGRQGMPPQIPPNSWLLFDVELVDVA